MSGIYYQNYVVLNSYRNQCAYVVEIWLLLVQYIHNSSALCFDMNSTENFIS